MTKNDLTSRVDSAKVESSCLRPSYGQIFTIDCEVGGGELIFNKDNGTGLFGARH